ncbi:MAG: site-specific integrase [Bifidobacteriaceae bacterium]|jgi:site-specific recombinase XerD|nr:site-specific integrase [Bifidobacteriaceae bacterium]
MGSYEFFRLVGNWLTVHLPTARRASPETVRSYRTALNNLVAYLRQDRGLALQDIGFDHVTRKALEGFRVWLTEGRHLAPSSANQRIAAVKSFLAYRAGEDAALVAVWLDSKQLRPMRIPERPPDALTMPAVEALIRATAQDTRLGVKDTTMILTLSDTAARVQELLDLKVGDMDTPPGAGRAWLTGKDDKTRTIPIMDKTCRHLDQYLGIFHPGAPDPAAPLFYTTWRGQRGPMSQDNVSPRLNKHAAAARPDCADMPEHIHAHQLRHYVDDREMWPVGLFALVAGARRLVSAT